ncbi:unnamed protein product [Haemonchus placei]|uniref:Guanylate cyclase domain-containing protein n=1 Tax=Haemonchus placei TaxID=6290 RepID=A0A3P8AGI0_HAEPC|nr:unnamed protein product [Haemonchus placei]
MSSNTSFCRLFFQGLNYIHNSFLCYHGRLTSSSCLVTDSFQVKLCDYGLSELARVSLVRNCWRENPINRPTTEFICEELQMLLSTASHSNLMDHVFSIMEEYTWTLEQEISDRTKELTEQKKKADLLLSKMLPREVAERLKKGQSVDPEGFDSVTVFFSDVVKFTILAAKCTPFQVVGLLNELYSSFDTLIEQHGVYKVESIGDGYLCVSGLPARNGHRHIKEIVEMSLSFMDYVDQFKVVPFPDEKIQLRIGVNSGSCVAGVVGLSMPRYCLFGDTVNTASRMESNGKQRYLSSRLVCPKWKTVLIVSRLQLEEFISVEVRSQCCNNTITENIL